MDKTSEEVSGQKKRPDCFGDPEKVSPKDELGFRQPQEGCLPCDFLKPCLQAALRKDGAIAPHLLDTPVVSKMTNFLKRWSDQKLADKNSRGDKTSP